MHHSNQFRRRARTGLFAATLLSLPALLPAGTITIAKSNAPNTPVEGGDTVRDFTGGVGQLPQPTAVLNDLGEVVFLASLTGNSASNIAILRGAGGPLVPLARKGDLTPDGTGTYDLLRQPAVNNSGHVVFLGFEKPSNRGTLYRLSRTNAQEVIQDGQDVPGGLGSFLTAPLTALSFPPRPNSHGHLAFTTTFEGNQRSIILHSVDSGLHTIAVDSTSNPLGGVWRSLGGVNSINDSNQVAFFGLANYPALSLRNAIFAGRTDGPKDTVYGFEGNPDPSGDGIQSDLSGPFDLNPNGEFAFGVRLTGTSGGTNNDYMIYRGRVGHPQVPIARRGAPAPSGIGKLNFSGLFTPKINASGQVAFASSLAGAGVGTTNNTGLYVGSGGPLTQIVIENQLAPTTTNTLAGRFDSFPSDFAFNDAGQVAFATTTPLRGVNHPTLGSAHGIFTGDGIDLINVARTGNAFENAFLQSFAVGRDGLNHHGQIVYQAALSTFNTSALLLWTPDLHWRFQTNGAWDGARRWTLSLTPAAMHQVFIQPTNAIVVTGPVNDVTVRSLQLGNVNLQLQPGATLTATGGVTLATNAILSGNGTFVASFTNVGTISPGASAGALAVIGDVTLSTNSVLIAELGGTGPADFDRLHVQGNLSISGALQIALINGHTLGDGQVYPFITVSGTRTGQFAGLSEGALVGNPGGRDVFITYTNATGIALFTTGAALPSPTVVFQPGGAAVELTFYGVAGQQYLLQRSESLSPPNWLMLQTLTAAPDGKLVYTDGTPPSGGAFYRITPL